MLFIIDSNEYIFTFGTLQKPNMRRVIDTILNAFPEHSIRIPRTIFEEVKRNISFEAFVQFNNFITSITAVDEDFVVPFEIVYTYESQGLKPADAFIAAYTEWTGANALVTENRHFLLRHSALPFKVLTAEKCLKLIK